MKGKADPPRSGAIAVLGPTGSGKSDFAMQLARELPVEIISVDSAQVYRGMDIGTAKPTPEERARLPHHLIDIREPESVYSAGEFRADCLALVRQIRARGRVPLLVGGTMMYFRALIHGIADAPPADPRLRESIDARAAQAGWPALHAELAVRDPLSAARIHPNDSQRIQRAIEVLALAGRPLPALWQEQAARSPLDHWQWVVLEPAVRSVLHERLARRLQRMMETGLVDEVQRLLARGTLSPASPALRLVGYRQLIEHCQGQESLQRATERALYATRQLAKRQLTWLRSATLLPDGAQSHRIDAFDDMKRERLMQTLIKSESSP